MRHVFHTLGPSLTDLVDALKVVTFFLLLRYASVG